MRNLLLSLALLAALTLSVTLAPRVGAQVPMPDLIVDQPMLAATVVFQSASFRNSDCAVVEGCAQRGRRKLMRFDVGLANVGDADLVLGSPVGNPLFEFSACHGHYHFSGAARYELLNASGSRVVEGRKQAFCLYNSQRYIPDAPFPSVAYDCNYQGLAVGWEDVYWSQLDCQWLDVTGVPAGPYTLRVTVNPDGLLEESDYTNNVAETAVTVP